MTLGSDLFRCVVAGSGQLSDRRMEMGDTLTREAGVPWEAMVAGPDDRRGSQRWSEPAGPLPEVGDDPTGWAAHVARHHRPAPSGTPLHRDRLTWRSGGGIYPGLS